MLPVVQELPNRSSDRVAHRTWLCGFYLSHDLVAIAMPIAEVVPIGREEFERGILRQ